MPDNRFHTPGIDARFIAVVDVRFVVVGVDGEFLEGIDTRFEGDTYAQAASFNVTLLGMPGEIGSEGSFGYSIDPDNGTDTVVWSLSSDPEDPGDFGTGANPTSLVSGNGQTGYLHVTDDGETVSVPFEIRHPAPTASDISQIYNEDVGDQTIDISSVVTFNGGATYALTQAFTGATLLGSTLTVDTANPRSGVAVVRVSDNVDATRFVDVEISITILPVQPQITSVVTVSKTDTSVTMDVTCSEAGTLFRVADASETEPSSQEVKELISDLGEAFATGSTAVSAGVNQVTITGLDESISVFTHFVLEDADGNLSPVVTHAETTNAAAPAAPTVSAASAVADGEDVLVTLGDLSANALDSRLVGVPAGETAPSVAQVLAGQKFDGSAAPIKASPAFTVGQTTAPAALPAELDATYDFYLVLSNGTPGAVIFLGSVAVDTTTPAPATGPTIVAFGSIGTDTPADGANYVHEFTNLAFGDARAERQLTVVGICSDADGTMAASTIGGQAVSVITDVGNGRPDMFVISAAVASGTTGTVRLDFGTDLARGVQFIVINHDTTDTITQLQKVIDGTGIPNLTSNVSEGAFLVGAGGAQIGIGSVGENPVVSWTGLTREDNPAEIDLWQPGGGNPIFANFATASNVSAGSRTVNFAIDGVPTSPRIAGLLIEIVGA
ncbi:MAG: hypothetical protein AAGK37_19415 [Pseudomonadota bacterium]